MNTRPYDIVLWGATGFTGRLVAERLMQRCPPGATWALAGRDRGKLAALREELLLMPSPRASADSDRAAELPILVGDCGDRASLEAIAAQSRVICTTVGPYSRNGRELVAACVAQRTHYCDITGEVQFIRDMVAQHHERARQDGTRIVNCCGFDSIPSDLSVYLLHEHAQREHGARLRRAKFFLMGASGGFSGGTISSMLNSLAELAEAPQLWKLLGEPYALNPPGELGPPSPDQWSLRYDRTIGQLTGPFLMGTVNTRIVRRCNAIRGYPYGRDFTYSEVMAFPATLKGLGMGVGFTAGMGAFVLGLWGPWSGLLQRWVLPKPGEGPSAQSRAQGFFKIKVLAEAQLPQGGVIPLQCAVESPYDPGYGGTARMMAESALCLAHDPLTTPGGVITPASAMGPALLTRLRQQGFTFQVTGDTATPR